MCLAYQIGLIIHVLQSLHGGCFVSVRGAERFGRLRFEAPILVCVLSPKQINATTLIVRLASQKQTRAEILVAHWLTKNKSRTRPLTVTFSVCVCPV